jgi:VanZ family protein
VIKNRWTWLFIALVYTFFILYVSLIDLDYYLPKEKLFQHQDKLFHFIVYIILAIFWSIYTLKATIKGPLWISFFATFSFGIALERVQEIISPFRTYDILDLIANCLGVIVGTIFVYCFMRYKVKID